jgi:hypothetical protein
MKDRHNVAVISDGRSHFRSGPAPAAHGAGGEQLPDGSTLKGVDVKANRISTENGDVIFD